MSYVIKIHRQTWSFVILSIKEGCFKNVTKYLNFHKKKFSYNENELYTIHYVLKYSWMCVTFL